MTVKISAFFKTYQLTSTYAPRPVACFCFLKKIIKLYIKANKKTLFVHFLQQNPVIKILLIFPRVKSGNF